MTCAEKKSNNNNKKKTKEKKKAMQNVAIADKSYEQILRTYTIIQCRARIFYNYLVKCNLTKF